MTVTRVLLLGGTTEAGLMARALQGAGVAAVYSYAGRTEAPVAQPLPVRVGGFGGVAGLAAYLQAEGISHVIDATHPFAAGMSTNAVIACAAQSIALVALEREPWVAGAGDRWTDVADMAEAANALSGPARRVFLAIGRQHLVAFAGQPQHHYLLRLVDPPDGDIPLPRSQITVARGPFTVAGDTALMRQHGTEIVVAKNAGGKGAVAKIAAARDLGLAVIMIRRPVLPERPELPERPVLRSVAAVMAWLDHPARLDV